MRMLETYSIQAFVSFDETLKRYLKYSPLDKFNAIKLITFLVSLPNKYLKMRKYEENESYPSTFLNL